MALSNEEIRRVIAEEGKAVYRLAMAQTRNSADADDIYQEVFLRFLRSKPEFAGSDHQRAWFLRVTVNCCRDLFKRADRRELEIPQRTAAAESIAEGSAELAEALEKLKPLPRALIHLHYYEGYKTEEIATLLEMKPATVRSGLNRARKTLKKLMEGGKSRV